VDRFGDELFAGAGLAGDENGGARGRHLADHIEQLHHALAFADDVGEAVALLESPFEVSVLIFEAPLGNHAVDLDDEFFVVPGLGEVVVGAELERFDGRLD
jgi:hypothetical protein